MKTAVSIPDALFEEADRLAGKLHKSRSQLYAEALAEYLARRDPEALTQTMNAVLEKVGSGAADPFVSEAARRALERTEW
jgi:metal-responsive CopG/Arc/MetJ family transcriptional regulator